MKRRIVAAGAALAALAILVGFVGSAIGLSQFLRERA